MKISYSPQLMEEAVFRHLNHLERSGMRSDYDEFHSLADPIYEIPEDDREEAFEKVNKLFFVEKLGLGDRIILSLEACGLIPKRRKTAQKPLLPEASETSETPASPETLQDEAGQAENETTAVAVALEEGEGGDDGKDLDKIEYERARDFHERIGEVVVKRAINKVDEGSNVLNRMSNRLPTIEMRLLASRFADSDESNELQSFLIHEFMHAKDMVDPEFDYEDAFIPGNPSVKNLITARFRLLWNVFVDSRLAKKGIQSTMNKEARFREFDNYYKKIPAKQRRGIFEGLWITEHFTHEELLSMATDLDTLMSKYVEYDDSFSEQDQEYIHLPGSPCPLCKFPTYNWVDDPESICDEIVIEAIQIDFPDWESSDGACDRCVEVYELRAGGS